MSIRAFKRRKRTAARVFSNTNPIWYCTHFHLPLAILLSQDQFFVGENSKTFQGRTRRRDFTDISRPVVRFLHFSSVYAYVLITWGTLQRFWTFYCTIRLEETLYQSQLVQFSQVFELNPLFISQYIKHLFHQTTKNHL